MAKRPTLRDIAKEADVALSTVSQVMNNKPNVSAETRQHVLKVASGLGYRAKIRANTAMAEELTTVGLLTKSEDDSYLVINPFYSHIIAGVERECQRFNINLLFANIEVDARNHAASLPPMLLDEKVDGVIVVGAFLEDTLTDISRRAGRNIVLVDAYTENDSLYDSVLIDNFRGAYTAVTHLIENGHQHIGLIGSNPDSYPSILERRQGYLAALHDHGIEQAYVGQSELLRQEAYDATINLLNENPQITAIFACNDNVAVGVMNAIRNSGRSIPEDVSVVGFDDIDLAQTVMPQLTTIHVDKIAMGITALRLLRDRVDTPDHATLKTLVTTHLVERESVRRITD